MGLQFAGFSISHIGEMRTVGEDRFAWASVDVYFKFVEIEVTSSVKIDVPFVYEPDWSIERVREEVYAGARKVVSSAGDLMGKNDLKAIVAKVSEKERQERAEADEASQRLGELLSNG